MFMFEPYLTINSNKDMQIIKKIKTSCHDPEIEIVRCN